MRYVARERIDPASRSRESPTTNSRATPRQSQPRGPCDLKREPRLAVDDRRASPGNRHDRLDFGHQDDPGLLVKTKHVDRPAFAADRERRPPRLSASPPRGVATTTCSTAARHAPGQGGRRGLRRSNEAGHRARRRAPPRPGGAYRPTPRQAGRARSVEISDAETRALAATSLLAPASVQPKSAERMSESDGVHPPSVAVGPYLRAFRRVRCLALCGGGPMPATMLELLDSAVARFGAAARGVDASRRRDARGSGRTASSSGGRADRGVAAASARAATRRPDPDLGAVLPGARRDLFRGHAGSPRSPSRSTCGCRPTRSRASSTSAAAAPADPRHRPRCA